MSVVFSGLSKLEKLSIARARVGDDALGNVPPNPCPAHNAPPFA